ncbi:MAG: sugar transferase [Candidatus Scalinduaceae bacterium]
MSVINQKVVNVYQPHTLTSILSIHLIKNGYQQLKPLLDCFISIVGLLIASPVFLAIGIIIKLTSRGPVFYAQERVGKDGLLFEIIKFRTMRINAESQTGPVWARKEDTRTTAFGRFLRRTHLDELPQLINVIRGEMSIVGPRPERPFFVSEFKDNIPGYTKRLSVKPGIAGMAQYYHKYDETIPDVQKKLYYDLRYIKRMCWMLDLKVFLLTVMKSMLGRKERVPTKLQMTERPKRLELVLNSMCT